MKTEALLTPADAAAILRIHPKTVIRMAIKGSIPGFRIGRQWRFEAAELQTWINNRMKSQSEGHE